MRTLVPKSLEVQNKQLFNTIPQYYVCDAAKDFADFEFLSDCNEYDFLVLSDFTSEKFEPEYCATLRKNGLKVPIVYLSSSPNIEEKLRCLDSGADIYLPTSVTDKEFLSVVQALVRRVNEKSLNAISFNCFKLDLNRRSLLYRNEIIVLRRKEYQILEYFCLNLNRVLSKEQILEHVWDDGLEVLSNTLEVHIMGIRNKLKPFCEDKIIQSRKGRGYVLLA